MSTSAITKTLKQKLIQQAIQRKLKKSETTQWTPPKANKTNSTKPCSFKNHPGFQQLQIINNGAKALGVPSPFFKVHQGNAGALSTINNKQVINFASYNYLNLSGHPEVNQAAIEATLTYGTSVSASRIVSGERPVHRELEQAIAQTYDVDDALVYVSGHATNVSTIGYLFGPKDLIIHDEYIHNSSVVGSQLSGAKRLSFAHNNLDTLEKLLGDNRAKFDQVLIIVEGLYSMDGDYPDLARLVDIKRRYNSFLMVDEAHSFGVLGNTGLGLKEHSDTQGKDVDIWMGTLSKTLSGCGGYIAGNHALIENLRFLSPGFLYSVGLPAPTAAAAITSLAIMRREPQRVQKLQKISQYFISKAKDLNFDTGDSIGIAIIPVILGSSVKAAQASAQLLDMGINVQPILYPAVPERSARLRFFLSCEHTEQHVDQALNALYSILNSEQRAII